MTLHLLTTQIRHNRSEMELVKEEENLVGMLRTSNSLYLIKEHMDGDREAIYHVNFINLLDKVFTKDCTKYLSIEQERYIDKFFLEAGIVDINITSKEDDPYKDMNSVMKQLDNFLGSYFGVDYGRFAR